MERSTKLARVYIEDETKLIQLRRYLTSLEGEQASFADVVRWLISLAEKQGFLQTHNTSRPR